MPSAVTNRSTPLAALRFAALAFALASCQDPNGSSGAACDLGVPRVLWCVPSPVSANSTPHDPAANSDRSSVYFATSDYRLKKIRGSDGAVIWDVDIGPMYYTGPNWNIVVSAGVVVVEKVDLFAYDTTTGALRWNYVAPNGEGASHSAITADDSTVYSASVRGNLYAIDARNGAERWGIDLREGDPDVFGLHPKYSNGAVYVCMHNGLRGTFWAVNAADGTVNWSYHFQPELPEQSSVCFGDAAFWHDLVIIPQYDGRVFAFDRGSGAVRWIAPRVHAIPQPNGSGGLTLGSWNDERWAASYGDNLIVTSEAYPGKIVAYDPATGAERWRNTEITAGHLGLPAMDESSVYLNYGWTYVVFDVATGKIRWKNPTSELLPPTMLFGRPVIAGDRIFLAGRDGSYAIAK
jgi:outer membrane protein assembly factor BamB